MSDMKPVTDAEAREWERAIAKNAMIFGELDPAWEIMRRLLAARARDKARIAEIEAKLQSAEAALQLATAGLADNGGVRFVTKCGLDWPTRRN